jgi:hypothetical protein
MKRSRISETLLAVATAAQGSNDAGDLRFAAVYTILGLATSLYVQNLVDHVLIGGNTRLLNMMGIINDADTGAAIVHRRLQKCFCFKDGTTDRCTADIGLLQAPAEATAAILRYDAGGRDHLPYYGCG